MLVVLTSIVSAAWGQLVVTDPVSTSHKIPSLTRGVVLAGIRNTGATTVRINTVLPPIAALPGCDDMLAHAVGGIDGNINRDLAPGEVLQIQVDAIPGWVPDLPTPHDCTFEVTATPASASTTMRVIFDPDVTPDPAELQPRTMSFGTPATPEQQVLAFINYTGATTSFRFTIMGDTRFRWAAAGCSGPFCDRNNVGSNALVQLAVECAPGFASVSAPLFVQQMIAGSGGPTLATTQLQCGGGSGSNTGMIAIVDDVSINLPPGTGAADVISLGQPAERLVSASLTPGSPVVFADPSCNGGQSCTWAGSGEALPRQLAMRCNAPGNATLQVTGSTSGSNAGVECVDTGGGPVIQVPDIVMSPPIPVIMTSSTTFQIANTGVAPLEVAPLSFPPPWSGNSGCIAGCTVGSGGSTSVGVAFSPLDWQPDPYIDTLVVSSNATNTPSANITLTGTGQGGTLDVTEPEVTLPNNLVIDFRRIARGPPAELPLELYADGNLPTITAMLAGLAPPFSATPSALGLGAGMTDAFIVRCGSDVALPPVERTITIQSNAYEITPTTQVTLRCEVLDTRVTVTPTTFAFDEVRVGSDPMTRTFTVTNEGTSPAQVDDIRLSGSSPVLALEAGATGMLPPDGTIVGSLTVTPSSEAEVELDLEVDVDGLVLAYPVTAKVVTPHAYITPTSLDLGTVCLGTQASGEVVVTNDGTATLNLAQPPTMDMAFIPFYDTIYPYELMPGRTVSAEIRPASATAGAKLGTLSWTVDGSLPPFEVPVSLETIDEGTAISPGKVSVGSWDVGTRSPDRVVRLENCSMAPVEIVHRGVVATRGRADAWDVRPETDARVLGPHDTMLITVAFAPPEGGTYRADLSLEIDGQQRLVPLEADAVGLFPDRTSFYACGCAGGSPTHGALTVTPIALAILLVVRRRRRPC